MRYKTSDLQGALLDEAVAKAQGYSVYQGRSARWCQDGERLVGYIDDRWEPSFKPSRSWWDSLPIILRNLPTIARASWRRLNARESLLRAYVSDTLGDEVEI